MLLNARNTCPRDTRIPLNLHYRGHRSVNIKAKLHQLKSPSLLVIWWLICHKRHFIYEWSEETPWEGELLPPAFSPLASRRIGDVFLIPSFWVVWGRLCVSAAEATVCLQAVSWSAPSCRETGQDSWLASSDIDLPQAPKQSLTCSPCPYFILCRLMLVLFDISFISTDPSFDTRLGSST